MTDSQLGLGLSQSELKALIEEADTDGDGCISLEEFVTVMKKTNLFK